MSNRPIRTIVVHCSDSPDTQDIGLKEITAWHKARGFDTVGYHAICRRDGTIEVGRPEETIGAHAKGHNADSLGVCVVGRRDFSPAQMLALITLLRSWMRKYKLEPQDVKGHYELDNGKTCPNLELEAVRKSLV